MAKRELEKTKKNSLITYVESIEYLVTDLNISTL